MIPCPKCSGYMFERRVRGVLVDLCAKCDGVWLDRTELAALTHTAADVPQVAVAPRPTAFACPRCGAILHERPYADSSPLELDVCTACNGVYLDRGELERIQGLTQTLDAVFTAESRAQLRQVARAHEILAATYAVEKPAAREPVAGRMQFVRNVYALLVLSLVVTALGGAVGAATGLAAVTAAVWASLALTVVFFVAALRVRKTPGLNLAALLAFTSLSGFSLTGIVLRYVAAGLGGIVWQAAGLTAATFLGLTAYVHFTRREFSWLRGMLLTALSTLVVSGFALVFVGGRVVDLVWSVVAALLFSGYLLYDTSRIIHQCDTTETVPATLDLYLDVVNLFLNAVRALARGGRV
ncbi:MAG: Bax inhibitor-1 family protein [Planctomycetes bacterium]|nr:Bax inhibitor-1 family protein [Planctomycetota bacterium]